MSCPASFQHFWSAFENNIDIAAYYRKICRDVHVSLVSNWRQQVDVNSRGLGTAYYFDNGYVSVPGKDYDNSSLGIPFSNDNNYSDATKMGFGNHSSTYTVAYISPGCAGLGEIYTRRVPGFYGYRYRANQRLYTNVPLRHCGAQAQAKTEFLIPGTAKREFLNISLYRFSRKSPRFYSEVPRFFTIKIYISDFPT